MEMTGLWGIAHRLADRLAALGIHTPIDLKRADPRLIRERFNVVLERTVYELRGVSCLDLEAVTPDRKRIMASRSFGQPVYTRQEMEAAAGRYPARSHERRVGEASERK